MNEQIIEAVYERLQTLDIMPTKKNMEKLLQCLYDLEEIYKDLKGDGTDGGENGPEAHPEQPETV